MAVVFEKLAVSMIEDLAKEILGEIIQAIEQLITSPADNGTRSAFTQAQVSKAAGLVNGPVNVLVIFQHDGHDASDLVNKGWKMGMLKCPCSHANNTLQYECYVGKTAAVFHLKGDGGYINWSFSGKFERHGNDVSFEAC